MVVEGEPFKKQFAQVTDSGRAVPKEKRWHASTRENSQDKWKIDRKDTYQRGTVGALEVESEPSLDFCEPYKPLLGSEVDAALWDRAQAAWKTEGLRKELIEASRAVPVNTCCCGLIPDEDQLIKDMVPYLNKHFVPRANEQLKKHGFEIDAFLWWWHNLQGKSETTIVLIRFFELETDG
mmetsp:Transcript_34007/g.74577  ORF Transcript_34007/g.74577 Transcript_34007/m.74577 type:complete len:180 (-) Transcript_34007:97-636(-)